MKTLFSKHPFYALFIIGILISFTTISCSEKEPWEEEVELLTEAMKGHTDFEAAQAAGYAVDATGYRTGMGHHFLNFDHLDKTFEITKPEVMLFLPDDNGEMQFVAVEYGIVIDDLNNPPLPPVGFTGSEDVWEISEEFSLWTLHVWIEMDNEAGVFAPRNPKIP